MREAVNQPAGGDPGHPRSDQGNALSAEEEPVIAMAQGAQDYSARARPLRIPLSVHAIFTISDFAWMRLRLRVECKFWSFAPAGSMRCKHLGDREIRPSDNIPENTRISDGLLKPLVWMAEEEWH